MLDWDIKSIPDLWLNSAEKKPDDQAIIHWDVMEGKHTWHNNELISAALLYTKFLIDNDVKKNDVCAVIIRHNPDFYPIYFAIGLIGAIPAILAYPHKRLHAEQEVTRRQIPTWSFRYGCAFWPRLDSYRERIGRYSHTTSFN